MNSPTPTMQIALGSAAHQTTLNLRSDDPLDRAVIRSLRNWTAAGASKTMTGWTFNVPPSVMDGLQSRKLPGESNDDAIRRMLDAQDPEILAHVKAQLALDAANAAGVREGLKMETSGPAVANAAREAAIAGATQEVTAALAPLSPEARKRVVEAMRAKFKRSTPHGFYGGVSAGSGAPYLTSENTWTTQLFEEIGAAKPDSRYSGGAIHHPDAWREFLLVLAAPVLQKCETSAFHRLVEAMDAGKVLIAFSDPSGDPDEDIHIGNVDHNVFVIRHDWAAAFAKAGEFPEGEVRLPYPTSVFEFRISGMRFIALTCEDPDGRTAASCVIFCETSEGWSSLGGGRWEHGRWCLDSSIVKWRDQFMPLWQLITGQIRAIAIVLEAKIAATEVVRAPHKLNAKRERAGKPPLYDYHVVDLAHRTSVVPRLPDGDSDDVRHRRLHFVRGHYRHFGEFKTWIKWHLRGDPDLGFVDKEYRL